ncbi:tRNA(His) guanylyltransferase Thg1 family protein [Archaeoglobus sp.]
MSSGRQRRKKINWKGRELYAHLLSPNVFILRIDGRNFTNVLKDFEKPYDIRFARAMVETCKEIMREFNPAFAYTFSDEVSFLLRDLFGCRVEKVNSIIASEFSSRLSLKLGFPVSFDSRIIYVSFDEIADYLKWRQDECWRNHINSYAFYTLLKEIGDRRKTQEFLTGKKSSEIHDLLFERGINVSKTPTWQRRGILLYWEYVEFEKEFKGRKVKVRRRRIVENWDLPLFDSEEGKKLIEKILSYFK